MSVNPISTDTSSSSGVTGTCGLSANQECSDNIAKGAEKDNSQAQDENMDTVSQKFAQSGLHFTLSIHQQCCKETEENLIFSPYSIGIALAMTYAGAAGDTEKEMRDVMNFDTIGDNKEVHESFKLSIDSVLKSPPNGIEIKLANKMYVHVENFSLTHDFSTILANQYGTTASPANFEDHEHVRKEINCWVEMQTCKKIKDLIACGVLDALTRLVLVNALYFKGDWATQFDTADTKRAKFHTPKGCGCVHMMTTTGKFGIGCSSDLQCRILELPYKNDTFSMYIILPNDKDGLQTLDCKLDINALKKLLSSMSTEKVKVTMPKFKLDGSIPLKEILNALGMRQLFCDSADLSGITGSKDLKVSAVAHKAFLEVNEEGSEVAAASSVVMMLRCAPKPVPHFKIDHPFILFVTHKPSGSVLLWGRIVNPKSDSDNLPEA